MRTKFLLLSVILFSFKPKKEEQKAWIRINQLGYKPTGIKAAVWCGKEQLKVAGWQLINAVSNEVALTGKTGRDFGAYGPFAHTYRFNFSAFTKPGRYYLQSGGIKSPGFTIGNEVYKGAADFCLRYMRQQRSGFNPFLKDSCHTQDGYVLYGSDAGIKDSTYIDVAGGWHDATDYLQYATTSANATYHLLMAYRDFPNVFSDYKQANGLDGSNGVADIADEAKWGLKWLLKMNPRNGWMFNQVADDRDHQGMRLPAEDSFYGKGVERPVYFVNGKPQQRGKFLNSTTGVASIAGKFSSCFALGAELFKENDPGYASLLLKKSKAAFAFGLEKPGVAQTVSVKSPYIYAEGNWVDDMELAAAALNAVTKNKTYALKAMAFADSEKITPWLGADTANHYQWYPFINVGHYELAKQLKGKNRSTVLDYYKQGIERVWGKAKQNAFDRGIPFIWCSNNLTVAFAIQCYWYRQLSGDASFEELEQANFDWLFGCNPWGTSFVYGLPKWGNTPQDPHSSFTHLKNYPIDGGLVDGPVYGSIFKSLLGLTLNNADEYAEFQSNLAVYHDDFGDYSTNEPTMDGTASLIYLLAARESENNNRFIFQHGAIVRGDASSSVANKKIALVFSGHEFAEGGDFIANTLEKEKINASFFFTGDFYRTPSFKKTIQRLIDDGDYLGPHSDKHLLYCDWEKRDSLLVSKEKFQQDLMSCYQEMEKHGINKNKAGFFLPPYEWHNDSIAAWTNELGLQLINYSPGTLSNADYTGEADKNFCSSQVIYNSIIDCEKSSGLNGFILLMHIGAGGARMDKFYYKLPRLIQYLKQRGYQFVRIDGLLKNQTR
ncbi:MAG: glycoside hydrolase family 9 protein [Bacteroidetes bacterium]|nr:glycoside hydrolase family 9 protein [Bacteroidota bacterium]